MKDSTTHTHRWTTAGLGEAPFKCVGTAKIPSTSLAEANPTAYNNALKAIPRGYGCGSCAVCGTPLTINFLIHSADGKRFAVGCDCVSKAGDAGLKKVVSARKNRLKREKAAKKREAKRIERIAILTEEEERARIAGWGMTKGEQYKAIREACLLRRKILIAPLAFRLEDNKSGFRDSVAFSMLQGHLPFANGEAIAVDILAKQRGRKGSKAYKAEARAVQDVFNEARFWITL